MIRRVGVIGAGTMGHGIAELCAISGFEVLLNDVNDELLARASGKMQWSLERMEKRGALKEDPALIMGRLKTTTRLEDFSGADIVIEAVKEKTEVKRQVLSRLGTIVGNECIIATNTSTIPVTELAGFSGREGKFLGLHFSNPPVMMPIVEIIRGEGTTKSTLNNAVSFVRDLGKDHVMVNRDIPGFLINRLNDRVISEAMIMLEEGAAPGALDALARFRLGFPMGICELLDFVGIDTVYNANREMIRRGFNSRTSEMLKVKVEDNHLGSKTGEGFYSYPDFEKSPKPVILPGEEMYHLDPVRLLAGAVNEAAWLIRNGVSSMDDVEKAMKLAMNWPRGPLEFADMYGIDQVLSRLRSRWETSGESRYAPDQALLDREASGELGVKTGRGFLEWRTDEEEFGPVLCHKLDNYAIIEINRPGKMNSLDEPTWKGLLDAFASAEADPRIRSVFLTGKGKAFSAGDDISMMDGWESANDAKNWLVDFAEPLITALGSFSKPLVSAVNGLAFGGGCEINMMMDIVISSENAIFSLPEGLIGAMPPIASSYGYGMINRKFARYALTGEWFSATEAMELDLVDLVVTEHQLPIVIAEFASRLAMAAPLASRSVKAVINAARQQSMPLFQASSNELAILSSTRDFKEGQRSFLRHGKPQWKGD